MKSTGSVGFDGERVSRLISALSVPDPWNLAIFVESIAAERGRPIRVLPMEETGGAVTPPCGLWVACEREDVILYSNSTSEYHAEQIILHELGHLLLDHGESSSAGPSPEQLADLMPHIETDTIRRVLGRTWFDSDQESEAELFASLMLSQGQPRARLSGILDTLLS